MAISLAGRLCLIAFLSLALAFTPLNLAIAATVKSDRVDTVKQAAQEVVKDTGAKEQFGKSENGDRLIDKAKTKASSKLNNLAEKADSGTDMPDSQDQFIDKVDSKS